MSAGGRVPDPEKGKYRFRSLTDILTYDPQADVWRTYSQMKLPRSMHAASAVTVTADMMEQCRETRDSPDNSLYGAVPH